jgi:hypothetical protein
MSWLISRALMEVCENLPYSPESAVESSEDTCSGGEQSAPLSVMPTPHKFWRNDKTMEFSRLSQFGLTCAVLTEDRGEELLTWFREGFRAKTFPQQVTDRVSLAQDPGCGGKWRKSSVKYDLESSSWKTHLCLWEEVLPWCSVILPKWGMTRSGALFQHPTLERPISVIAAGLWPTPNAMAASNDLKLQCSGDGRTKPNKLGWAIAHSGENGHMNPEWVEWLMGWPTGWTDLKPLETDKFQEWQQQHSISSQDELDE